jgi:D-tagatose-1,6-bisphosphate aldolase subunit GatZ/KbaZ
MSHLLDDIVRAQKAGEVRGIPSICSAHPAVLTCALRHFRPVLIESTCNQVNQFGGYTGMTPAVFFDYAQGLAKKTGFPLERLILGGDHLGPSPWQDLPAEEAMSRAEELVHSYARAGFTKLHIDASMKLGGDEPCKPLPVEISARRTALLIRVAENTVKDPSQLRYVIGSEVPVPGGAHEHEIGVQVSLPENARQTIEASQSALTSQGLEDAWSRVIALVVQPGVEFGSDFIVDYDPTSAQALAEYSENTPLVFEAHSTDYQTAESLGNLVHDHFAILKVGPALTFAYREAIFALAGVEDVMIPKAERSNLVAVIEEAMLRRPEYWRDHYMGTFEEQVYQRKFSLSDRIRYYWMDPAVVEAVMKLLKNLEGREVPFKIMNNILPELHRMNQKPDVDMLIENGVQLVLDKYYSACGFEH